ncbi:MULTISPECIES: hypothetical protein, partial [unclassified Rhodococcus (in: high G+C Gram-positive bacteria)]|uniref:hypothetical protein n=1 Tax=unclassified Rhodococcus (in: high G+C Gram-positive bacteria) TaxID=192944 RepID=UPI00113FF72B
MQFTKRLWKNKPDNTTSIDAANLNRFEDAHAAAAEELGTKANAQAVADALATKLSEAVADTRYAPVDDVPVLYQNEIRSIGDLAYVSHVTPQQ